MIIFITLKEHNIRNTIIKAEQYLGSLLSKFRDVRILKKYRINVSKNDTKQDHQNLEHGK